MSLRFRLSEWVKKMSMCKLFKKTESEKEPKSVIACYLQKLEKLIGSGDSEGNYAYRGQANTEGKEVESGAFRRLKTTNREVFISYHEKELLEPARMDGHGVGEDRPLYDLELLAKLQHHGAATCLIDFTRNFLVAMWFACEPPKEEAKKTDGIIFILNTSDEKNFRSMEEKDLEKKVRPILTFQTRNEAYPPKEATIPSLPKPLWWHWSPHGLLEQRVLKQDSVFIFGQPKMEGAPLKKIEIKHEHKDKILEELERLGITERTLFKDLPGFAYSHGRNKSLPRGYGTPKYYLRKGDEALQRDDFRGAMADYNEAVKLNSDYVEAYFNRGIAKSNLRDFNGAIADLDRVIKLDPDYVEAYFSLGNVKFSLGDHSGAIADYDKAIKLKPDFVAAYNNRGVIKACSSDYSSAIEDYDQAIKLKPDFAEAYHNRGDVKAGLRKHSEAIADYDRAIKLDPDLAGAYHNRGLAKSNLGDHSGAIADFNRAIELKPNYAEAYYSRGIVNRVLKRHSEAIADYNRAIELKPDYAEAYFNRGEVKFNLGVRRDAIADYNRAIELEPDFAKAYNNRGMVESILGEHRNAIADFDQTIKLKPDDAEAYYNRGLAYDSLKDKEKARRSFLRARELVEQSGNDQPLNLIDEALSKLDNENNNRS